MTACAAKFCSSAICLVGKWPHLLAIELNGSQQAIVFAQRHHDAGAGAAQVYEGAATGITRVIGRFGAHIRLVDNAFTPNHADEHPHSARIRAKRPRRQILDQMIRTPGSRGLKLLSVIGPQGAKRRFAQPHGLLEHCVEHRSEIAGRGIDDLQDLGGRGLLLQRLTGLGQEPRVLHRDHRLRREIFEQRDLSGRKGLDLASGATDDPD